MIIRYFFSSPIEDIPLSPDELATSFKTTPSEDHAFLTLGDYFETIKDFILKDQAGSLIAILREQLDKSISLGRIDKLLIRSEKHGALYHISSVEIVTDRHSLKFAVCTAVSEKGKAWLTREYDTLNFLSETFDLHYLPKVYFKGEMEHRTGTRKESFSMFLAEWFEGYHEWHLSIDEKDKSQNVCIWNLKEGHRIASSEESYEIYKQASKILTLYYDTQDYRQIFPWHHAAGDFVVKAENGMVNVKLTTARTYEPVMTFLKDQEINPLVAIIYFFLNLTVRMGLDKIDGVGKVSWAGNFSLEAVTEGFFEALRMMAANGRYRLGRLEDLLSLLKNFNRDEFNKLLQPLLELYRNEDLGDVLVIEANLETYTTQLYRVIQKYRL